MLGDKFNLGGILKNAKKMQEMVEQAQEELANLEVTGESGAGAVTVIVTAKHQVKKIHIDDELLKEPKEVIEELIAGAINNANEKVEELTKSKMMDASQLFGTMGQDEDKS